MEVFQGQATDIRIHTEWLLKTKNKINKIYSEKTKKPIEEIERDMERELFYVCSRGFILWNNR